MFTHSSSCHPSASLSSCLSGVQSNGLGLPSYFSSYSTLHISLAEKCTSPLIRANHLNPRDTNNGGKISTTADVRAINSTYVMPAP